jgi:hypothetical protein
MPFRRAVRLLRLVLLCALLSGLGLAGCRREVQAPGDPVAAVRGMAEALRKDDLVRYSRLSMPPELHRRMEARWSARLKVAPPPSEKERRDYARWMARLTAPDAEQQLFFDFNGKMRKFDRDLGAQWPLMQATGGLLANGLIQSNRHLSVAEKAHAKSASAVLLGWMTPAMVSDRTRARAAIRVLVATARELELPTLEASRSLEMIPALEKGGRVLHGLKGMAKVYGIDANASLAALQARVVDARGDRATVEVSYPLLGRTVRFDMALVRRDGRWYSADAVEQAQADLAKPLVPASPTAAR